MGGKSQPMLSVQLKRQVFFLSLTYIRNRSFVPDVCLTTTDLYCIVWKSDRQAPAICEHTDSDCIQKCSCRSTYTYGIERTHCCRLSSKVADTRPSSSCANTNNIAYPIGHHASHKQVQHALNGHVLVSPYV